MRTISSLFDLTGRVALITGGAGHIGSAIAEALDESGCCGIVVDLQPCRQWDDADDVVPYNWRWADGPVTYYTVQDITAQAGITATLERVNRIFSRLDILVNCAAMTSYPTGFDVPFPEQSMEAWDACMNVNLRAPFLLSQACAPLLAASGHGSIINVGSIYGMVGPDLSLYDGTGMGCAAAYAASKGGLLQLTRYLATVLAPSVRVNSITPGGVLRGQDAAFVERYSRKVPLGRMGKEEDFKGAAVFLASDASGYVTGVNIPIEGGGLAQW